MDCIEAIALRPSLRREISMKSTTQQAFFDDVFWCSTGVSGDDFPIDDLLDFSNEDFTEEEEEEKSIENDVTSNSASFSATGDFGVFPADEFAVPVDDLDNLEWLSRFVDDSVSEFPLLPPAGNEKTGSCAEKRSKPGSKQALPLCFLSTIPAKTRNKRPRCTGRVWSLESPSLSESSSSPSPSRSSSPTPSRSSSPTPCLVFTNTVQTMDLFHSFEKPPVKKQKKKPAAPLSETGGGVQFQRRCSHCQVQKTPQWRTGPLGAKTLCNACGVRFKSGRLYPEYRPACSPTFSGDIHSNIHRKVLELQGKKEMGEPDSRLAEVISSC